MTKPKAKTTYALVVVLLLLFLSQACQQRFWFRKKSGDNHSTDSGEVDKDYKIIW
jgi:hypothetical protein